MTFTEPHEGLHPGSTIFGDPPLPGWVEEFRPHQVQAANEIIDHYQAGVKVVFLDAPTGSGKTLIGEMVRRLMRTRSKYVCTSLTLQDQFLRDFPYAEVLKGRGNYPTLDEPDRFNAKGARQVSCADCTREMLEFPACEACRFRNNVTHYHDGDAISHCDHCHPTAACPYVVQREIARYADLAVLNTAYFLTAANYVALFGETIEEGQVIGWSHPFAILDEADSLEDQLMGFVEWSISEREMNRLGIAWPEKKTVPQTWPWWAENEALPKLDTEERKLRGEINDFRGMGMSAPVELTKRHRRINNLGHTLYGIKDELEEGWVYSGYDRKGSYASVTFKPIKVDGVSQRILWRHADHFLLMSATIISAAQMAFDLGLEDHEWAEVRVTSSFPPERRPVYIRPRASMTAKTKDESYPKMTQAIDAVLDAHPDERVLVHTVSYDLTKYLHKTLTRATRPVLAYFQSETRAGALQEFRDNERSVLLAPSFDRGVDLPDDECRVVVVAKVPFPYLGDKQISKRLHTPGGQGWYSMQTVRSLVQMTGRAMRHEDDQCSIYVLDSQFLRQIWKKNRDLLPYWWTQAIQWQP